MRANTWLWILLLVTNLAWALAYHKLSVVAMEAEGHLDQAETYIAHFLKADRN
jgi:hypothetical protein